jgi:hypothetical protein
MQVYILGDCENIQLAHNIEDAVLVVNAPDDIMAYGSEKYGIVSYNAETKEAVFINKIQWLEPEWQYRANITNEQLMEIADKYPELLVSLNTEPKNPKYKMPTGSIIYFNTFGKNEQYIFNELGIVKENKPNE